jgi:hypothetical protein
MDRIVTRNKPRLSPDRQNKQAILEHPKIVQEGPDVQREPPIANKVHSKPRPARIAQNETQTAGRHRKKV